MEIWLDTTNIELIKSAEQLGILYGVTTNPSILAKSGRGIEKTLQEILDAQGGPVTTQVVADNADGMISEADRFRTISDRIIIKVPVTVEGLKAIHLLSRQGIPTMATTVFHPNQALLAALAGADFVAPYLSQMEKAGEKAGENALELLQSMMQIFSNYHFETKILVASLQDTSRVKQCAEIGVHGVTLKDDVFNMLIENNGLTMQRLDQFTRDWAGS